MDQMSTLYVSLETEFCFDGESLTSMISIRDVIYRTRQSLINNPGIEV